MHSERPDYSGILIAVDDMRINDASRVDNCDLCKDDDTCKGGYRKQIPYGDEVSGCQVLKAEHTHNFSSLSFQRDN